MSALAPLKRPKRTSDVKAPSLAAMTLRMNSPQQWMSTPADGEAAGAGGEADERAHSAWLGKLLETRRSVRIYDGRLVPREATSELVELATRAPSNFNRQPWHFVVADTPAWCRRIAG